MTLREPQGGAQTDKETVQEKDAQTWAIAAREMRTRDADAAIYDDFFTDFQTAVEFTSYRAGLEGAPRGAGLDLACGNGRTMGLLTAGLIVGVDFSRKELLIAKKRFPNAELIQASATHLPFKDGVFDQTLCAGLLLHMPNEEVRLDILREMGRTGARPGRLVVATHSWPVAVRRQFEQDREEHELFWHRTKPRELESLMRRSLAPCTFKTWSICHLPRWKVGNKLGRPGVVLDTLLSKVPALKHFTGSIVVAKVDLEPGP